MSTRVTRRPGLRFLAFALLSGGLALFVAAQIIGFSTTPRVPHEAVFADASGVQTGDLVRLAGVPVGAVTGVTVEDGSAVVAVEVDRSVALPTDTVLAVSWRDLTGARQLDLLPGEADTTLAPGDVIERTRPAVDLSQLTNRLGPLARALDPEQLNQLLTSVDAILAEDVDTVTQLTADTSALLQAVASRRDRIDGMITDYGTVAATLAEREQQMRRIVDDLVKVAEAFGGSEQVLGPAIDDASGLLASLDDFLDANAERSGQLVEELSILTETATGRIDELESGLRRLPSALTSLYGAVRHGDMIRVDAVCAALTEPPCPVPNSGRSEDGRGSLTDLLLGELAP